MNKKINTLFIGTSEFGIPTLKTLLELDFINVIGVITQPDRPYGRKQELKSTPIKEFISNIKQIPVFTPENLNKNENIVVENLKPELVIVASYGQIISKKILAYPKYGALNLHGSILPKLRGAVPVQMSVLYGFKETGVTLQKMVYKLDAGEIISTKKITLSEKETSESLMNKLSELSAEIISTDLRKWVDGEIIHIKQNDEEATFCDKTDLEKDKAEITYGTDIIKAERMIRAFTPWPIAWIELKEGNYKGKRLKIFKAEISYISSSLKNGIHCINNEIFLKLNNGLLKLIEIQLEGKEKKNAWEYLFLTK